MSPRIRKFVLTAHVTTSVGWLGAVVAYIALDVAAVAGQDLQQVRGAYLGMELIAQFVIVPLALASVLIGIVNALGTSWGLFRHYWVLVKLLLTTFATTILLLEMQIISDLAQAAASAADPRDLPGTLPHSIGGLVVLMTIAMLSIFKPRGMTRYGQRRRHEQQRPLRELSQS